MLTDGRGGAFVCADGGILFCPAAEATVAGTAGAGDAIARRSPPGRARAAEPTSRSRPQLSTRRASSPTSTRRPACCAAMRWKAGSPPLPIFGYANGNSRRTARDRATSSSSAVKTKPATDLRGQVRMGRRRAADARRSCSLGDARNYACSSIATARYSTSHRRPARCTSPPVSSSCWCAYRRVSAARWRFSRGRQLAEIDICWRRRSSSAPACTGESCAPRSAARSRASRPPAELARRERSPTRAAAARHHCRAQRARPRRALPSGSRHEGSGRSRVARPS